MKFICAECSGKFDSKRVAKFCSQKCREDDGRKRAREAYQKKIKATRGCAACGLPVGDGRSPYCSDGCKEDAAEERRAREAALQIPPTHAAGCDCGVCAECRLTVVFWSDVRALALRRIGDVS